MARHTSSYHHGSHSNFASLGIKTIALKDPKDTKSKIHISQAIKGEKYYHTATLAEMYARRNVPTPHFVLKGDPDPRLKNLHHSEHARGNSTAHDLLKLLISLNNRLVVTVGDKPVELKFKSVKQEHFTTDGRFRIDAVCMFHKSDPICKRLGPGINLEIVCSSPVDEEKVVFFRTLPFSTAILNVPPYIWQKISTQERSLHNEPDPDKIRYQWDKDCHSFMFDPWHSKHKQVVYIPNEGDPRKVLKRKVRDPIVDQLVMPPTKDYLPDQEKLPLPQPLAIKPMQPRSIYRLNQLRRPSVPTPPDPAPALQPQQQEGRSLFGWLMSLFKW